MKIYNAIFEGYEGTEQDAISYGAALIPCEVETTEQTKPAYSDHITSFDGVGVYYCYGADHYFYVDETAD